jgi:intein/homing endonuclease
LQVCIQLLTGIQQRTDIYADGYGYAEIEQLVTILTSVLYAESYNRNQFSQGAQPKGVLNLKGDNWTKDQLEDFRRHWTSQVAGVENCVAGNTKIWTPYGAQEIATLLGDEKEKEIKIWTGKEWCSALAYKTKEPKKLVHTKLWNGLKVSTSPDHKFKVLGENGPEWKIQSDLEIGDYVLVNKKSIESSEIPHLNINGENKQLTEGMLEVLGWQIGDGYIAFKGKNKRFQLFYHHDKEAEIRERHLSILKSFGLPARSKDKLLTEEDVDKICEKYGFKTVSGVRRSIELYNSEFTTQLVDLGFCPSSIGKSIPSFVFSLPESYKGAFLRGLFSADGNLAKKRSPELSISDDSLREEVKLLLISMGIRTCKSEGKTKILIKNKTRGVVEAKSILRIKDRDRFLSLISFLQDHKQPTEMKKLNELGKTNRISSHLTIKYAKLCQKTTRGTKLLSSRERANLSNIVCGRDGCSLNNLISYMKKSKIDIPDWMTLYNFEPIIDFEETNEVVDMYDVSVYSEEHQFIASGVVCHNSWKTPVMQSEGIEWIDLQQSNRDMEYNALCCFLD